MTYEKMWDALELADDAPDNHRNVPRPSQDCLYGLIGDIARAGGNHTEANPYAVGLNAIAYVCAAIGRKPFIDIGNTRHHCRIFTQHIGRSGVGRKGDAVAIVHRIDIALRSLNIEAAPKVHRGGLSSREGLIYLFHDGFTDGKTDVPAVLDKRLWVVESEFANVLMQAKREGNTLSPALRDCFDGVSISPATKSARLSVTDPHVCLSVAITPSELRSSMAARELTNGFANRFLPIWAERTKIVPFPVATPQSDVDALARRLLEVLEFCQSASPAENDSKRVELTASAKVLYEQLYRSELNDTSAGEHITALIERRAPMLLRLAMMFALCDLTTQVDDRHIKAALAWIRYSVESVKFVFASAADEVAVTETNETAQKIIAYLATNGTATRSEITSNCFQGHTTKSRIDAALDELLSSSPPRILMESRSRPRGSPGSATKIYTLTAANSANCANGHVPCGLARDFADCELSETCEISTSDSSTSSTVRTNSKTENKAQSHTSIDNSHNSQSSQRSAGKIGKVEIL
jgi:Protein of unknown function (DUF3987)